MAGLKKARRAASKAAKSKAPQQYQHRAMTAEGQPNKAPSASPYVSPFVMTTDTASGTK